VPPALKAPIRDGTLLRLALVALLAAPIVLFALIGLALGLALRS
jgi:hypothetical protein